MSLKKQICFFSYGCREVGSLLWLIMDIFEFLLEYFPPTHFEKCVGLQFQPLQIERQTLVRFAKAGIPNATFA